MASSVFLFYFFLKPFGAEAAATTRHRCAVALKIKPFFFFHERLRSTRAALKENASNVSPEMLSESQIHNGSHMTAFLQLKNSTCL